MDTHWAIGYCKSVLKRTKAKLHRAAKIVMNLIRSVLCTNRLRSIYYLLLFSRRYLNTIRCCNTERTNETFNVSKAVFNCSTYYEASQKCIRVLRSIQFIIRLKLLYY